MTVNPGYPFQFQFAMAAMEYMGVSAVDATSTMGGTIGTSVSSGVAPTRYPNEVVLGVGIADVDVQAGAGFTSRFVSNGFCVEDKFVQTAGNYEGNCLTTQSIQYEGWDAAMATFH